MAEYKGYQIKYKRALRSFQVFNRQRKYLGLYKTREDAERIIDTDLEAIYLTRVKTNNG